jgi:hypothetical protein
MSLSSLGSESASNMDQSESKVMDPEAYALYFLFHPEPPKYEDRHCFGATTNNKTGDAWECSWHGAALGRMTKTAHKERTPPHRPAVAIRGRAAHDSLSKSGGTEAKAGSVAHRTSGGWTCHWRTRT